MSIPKTTISMTGVNQQRETEIKVKVTSVIIEPCSFNITCFCYQHKTLFHQQVKVERSRGGRGIITPMPFHTVY